MNPLAWAVVLLAGVTCTQGTGTQTTIENYPSLAQIEFRVATVWLQQCVGSIITNFHIVSAASCFQDVRTNRLVRLGSGTRGDGGTLREVHGIVNHASYNPETNYADISVIRVNASILFGNTINPVQILPQDYYIPENIEMSTAGWGITAEGGSIGNSNLYSLGLLTKSFTACLARYPGRVTSNNICVGLSTVTGRDFDARDTGGPVYYQNILSGIISYGSIRKNNEFPIVSISTGAYSNWIVSNAV